MAAEPTCVWSQPPRDPLGTYQRGLPVVPTGEARKYPTSFPTAALKFVYYRSVFGIQQLGPSWSSWCPLLL